MQAGVVDLVVSCALDTTVTNTAMPLGDPCSLTSVLDCLCNLGQIMDTLQTADGGEQQSSCCSCSELVSEQSQPQSGTQGSMHLEGTRSGPLL